MGGGFEGKLQKKVLETGVSLCRGLLGNQGCLLTGNSRDSWRALCESSVRGASFWGSARTWGGGLRGRTSLPNITGVRSPGTLGVR
jgi:hypothetical protein